MNKEILYMKGNLMLNQISVVESLEEQLGKELRDACSKSKRYVGQKSLRVLSLLDAYGAVETVKKLVKRNTVNDWFVDLILNGKVKLTMEHIICKDKYRVLFDDELRAIALRKITFGM
jgi:hypothetical protein